LPVVEKAKCVNEAAWESVLITEWVRVKLRRRHV